MKNAKAWMLAESLIVPAEDGSFDGELYVAWSRGVPLLRDFSPITIDVIVSPEEWKAKNGQDKFGLKRFRMDPLDPEDDNPIVCATRKSLESYSSNYFKRVEFQEMSFAVHKMRNRFREYRPSSEILRQLREHDEFYLVSQKVGIDPEGLVL